MPAWVDIAVGAGGSATAFGLVGSVFVSQLKHAVRRVVAEEVKDVTDGVKDEIKEVKDGISDLHLKFAKETGGNSNGLRQKVNEMSRDVIAVGKDVAHLKGAFEQHTHTVA